MSVEALTYAKLTDLDEAESDGARLLFYVIAENTFNDTGLCKVGQSELVYQTRSALRSIQRRIAALDAAGKIKVTRRGGDGAGRKPDQIEIIGFQQWLAKQRLHTGKVQEGEQPAKLASCQIVRGNPPNSKGQPANSGGFIKGNRTRESVQETNSISGFESEVERLSGAIAQADSSVALGEAWKKVKQLQPALAAADFQRLKREANDRDRALPTPRLEAAE